MTTAFLPTVSLHAAARSAQARGEPVASSGDLAPGSTARKRSQRHLLRVFKDCTPFIRLDDTTGVWTNKTRTWALVICDGVIVTAIFRREYRFTDGKLSSVFKRLVKRRFNLDDDAIRSLEAIE